MTEKLYDATLTLTVPAESLEEADEAVDHLLDFAYDEYGIESHVGTVEQAVAIVD